MLPVNPAPAVWRCAHVSVSPQEISLRLEPIGKEASCPGCRCASRRVHSWYWRRAGDLPCAGRPLKLLVHVRRYFCATSGCRATFAERFDGVLARYGRRTERTQKVLLELAHASSGEGAARIARLLGFEVSADTLLRLQRREVFIHPAPMVIGVDEFAWRKRSNYGTLVVDLERRQPLDLLPTDTVKEFAHWLERHPPVAAIARDRDAVFARAAREVVPGALQVADRFHLVMNVMDAFRTFVLSRRWETPSKRAESPAPEATVSEMPLTRAHDSTPRKRLLWEQVQALGNEGHTIRAIARALGTHRRTVRKYLSSESPPVYRTSAPRRTKLEPYVDHLRQRWLEGVHNAARLYEEIRCRGYDGRPGVVRQVVHPWRAGLPRKDGGRAPPSGRLVLRWRASLTEEETTELDQYLELNSELSVAYTLKEMFRNALSSGGAARLDEWLEAAKRSGIDPFVRLAKSIRQDHSAVSAAFTSTWSTGQCEGQINRVKLLKRIGYGRARPDLLRVRVLHRMPVIGQTRAAAA